MVTECGIMVKDGSLVLKGLTQSGKIPPHVMKFYDLIQFIQTPYLPALVRNHGWISIITEYSNQE